MKTSVFCYIKSFSLCLLLIILTSSVLAVEKYEVFPTGVFPDDINNIQWLLDDLGTRGVDGKFILRAINEEGLPTPFNFGTGEIIGPPEAGGERWLIEVRSTQYSGQSGNIEIKGQIEGQHQTTVLGGYLPINVFREAQFTISGIIFENAMFAPVIVRRATDVYIKNNVVIDVIAEPFGQGDLGALKGVGFWVLYVTGKVTIKNNEINGVFADSGDGIAIVATTADINIVDNTIANTNRSGILLSGNAGKAVIRNNIIAPGPGSDAGIFANLGVGIVSNCQIGPWAMVDIRNNRIETEGLFSWGILLEGLTLLGFGGPDIECPVMNSIISGNEIHLTQGEFGIYLGSAGGGVFGNSIEGNKLSGAASTAGIFTLVEPFPGSTLPGGIYSNVIKNNEFDELETGIADVLLDPGTFDNLYFGEDEYVLDLGTNNIVRLGDEDDGEDD